jgi:hypothetical protein
VKKWFEVDVKFRMWRDKYSNNADYFTCISSTLKPSFGAGKWLRGCKLRSLAQTHWFFHRSCNGQLLLRTWHGHVEPG